MIFLVLRPRSVVARGLRALSGLADSVDLVAREALPAAPGRYRVGGLIRND
jgi:hypothetical protein